MWSYLTTAQLLILIGVPSEYCVLLSYILVFCYMSFLYELVCIFFIEPWAAFYVCILKFLASPGHKFPISQYSNNSMYSLFLTPFDGKISNLIFIFLNVLKPRVLNLVVLIIQDNRLLNVGKDFRCHPRFCGVKKKKKLLPMKSMNGDQNISCIPDKAFWRMSFRPLDKLIC